MTREEKIRAAKVAQARVRQSQLQAQATPERGIGARLYDNLIGSDDGVTSTGEAIGTWLNRAGESMTLGLIGDEASAAVTGQLPGRDYGSELERYRGNEEGMSTLGRLSADVGGAVLPALAGVGIAGQAATVPGRMVRGAQLGAAAGATQGFMEGENGIGDRVTAALVGGGIGGTIGGAIPGVAEVGRQLYRAGEGAVRNSRVGSQIGQQLGVSPAAGRFMGDAIGGEDAATMAQALQRAGPDAMLADASPALAGRLDATMRSPVPGAGVAQQRVTERAGSAYNQIIDALDGGRQGPQMPVQAQMNQIRTSTAAARGSAYDAAYKQEIDWQSPAGERLRALLDSTPDEVKNAAARSRGMRVQAPTDSRYADEFADSVTTTRGPDSWITQEADEIDQFAAAYNGTTGRFAKRPLSTVIRQQGGIDPDGPAGRELKAMGLTSRNSPGLFRKGGLRDVDNLSPDLFPDVVRGRGDGTGNYMDRDAILENIRDEMNGIATRSSDDMLDARAVDEMERLVPEYDARAAELAARTGGPSAPAPVSDAVPMQTVEDIDMIKRQLDAVVATNDGQGLLGGQTPYGLFAKDRAVAIREALKEAAPAYGNALETAADPIRRRQAVEFGSKLLSPRVTTEEALQEIATATGGERAAMREGMRAQINETLGNVRAVASDQNIEPRQAMQALRELSSPNAQRKMEALYGDEWPGIKTQIDRASSALGLRAATSANSATAARLGVDREITESVTPGALRRGQPLEAGKNFIGGITGASPEAIARMRDEVKGEVAEILTRQGGTPQKTIDAVTRALMANPANPQAGNALGRALTAGGFAATPAVTERLQRILGTLQ